MSIDFATKPCPYTFVILPDQATASKPFLNFIVAWLKDDRSTPSLLERLACDQFRLFLVCQLSGERQGDGYLINKIRLVKLMSAMLVGFRILSAANFAARLAKCFMASIPAIGHDEMEGVRKLLTVKNNVEDFACISAAMGGTPAQQAGWTQLMCAAADGDLLKVHQLLKAGAKKDEVKAGMKALGVAMAFGHGEVANLLERYKPPGLFDKLGKLVTDGLLQAVERRDTVDVLMLLDKGADTECRDETSATPLLIAAKNGHVDAIRALLQAGANREAANKTGWTALHIAAQNGHVAAVAALLKAGANKEAAKENGATPLFIAAKNGHVKVVVALLQKDANKDMTNKKGATPLFIAAKNGHVEVVAALLQKGANKEAATQDGWTAFHIAAENGHVEVVAALLQEGANTEAATNEDRWTPLLIAAQNGHVEIVAVLLQKGANTEAATQNGATPLFIAAQNGHVAAVAALLQAGANKEAGAKVRPPAARWQR
ncbi:hypothetical protein GPECTOR_49g462 [Gonium pectorale]|uniref:Uncharacterized protein n=1 Tax=Gonium pectorale TaxID=33097 RepID=A0A150G7S8_GONPE|nr:hypothetical protein GPECTOR_49g462 [Gonium pectorale]|eukprot:KXZ45878.1 hypothetical protein GPECTOR_49g462 [Gonium pectorale]